MVIADIGLLDADNRAKDLITAAQPVTGAWADLGPVVIAGDYDLLALWLKITINDTLDFQVRVIGSNIEAFTDSYVLPISDISSATKIGLSAQVFELSSDATQNMIIPMAISDAVPFIKFQIQALTPGVTPASVTSAKVSAKTTGRKS